MPDCATMKGIRTYFRRNDISWFRQAYWPLYPFLRNLFFVETICAELDPCFKFPWDDDTIFKRYLDSRVDQRGNDGLFQSETLIRYDQYIDDDWNVLVLADIPDLKENRRPKNKILDSTLASTELETGRVIFFHNYDGAFWQFFTNDEQMIDSMLRSQKTNADLYLRYVQYHNDYPNPGAYRDDDPPRV